MGSASAAINNNNMPLLEKKSDIFQMVQINPRLFGKIYLLWSQSSDVIRVKKKKSSDVDHTVNIMAVDAESRQMYVLLLVKNLMPAYTSVQ